METYLEVGSCDPTIEENSVEFRLLFDGPIGSDSRAPIKHEIRRAMHPQLRRLWLTHRKLRKLASYEGQKFHAEMQFKSEGKQTHLSEDDAIQFAFKSWGENWNRDPFHCVPLVTKDRGIVCRIEILLLRPEDDTHVLAHGDLDGQVKTLFDGLRMPSNLAETGNTMPTPDEDPFFCLLEDDRLVSELRINSDKLLLPPHKSTANKQDAFAVITVNVNHKYPGSVDSWFT
jgi:hypothetical protein